MKFSTSYWKIAYVYALTSYGSICKKKPRYLVELVAIFTRIPCLIYRRIPLTVVTELTNYFIIPFSVGQPNLMWLHEGISCAHITWKVRMMLCENWCHSFKIKMFARSKIWITPEMTQLLGISGMAEFTTQKFTHIQYFLFFCFSMFFPCQDFYVVRPLFCKSNKS